MRVSSATKPLQRAFSQPAIRGQVKSVRSQRREVPLVLGPMQRLVIGEKIIHCLHPEIPCGTPAEKTKSSQYADKLSNLTPPLREVVDYFLNDHSNLPPAQRNNLNSLPSNIQTILRNHKVN